MTPILKGTAARLGLRKPWQVRLARISGGSGGELWAVCSMPGRKSFVVDHRGRAVRDCGFVVGAGQIGNARIAACTA